MADVTEYTCLDNTFVGFRELPKELRIMVWELALLELRVVSVLAKQTRHSSFVAGDLHESRKFSLVAQTPPPKLLLVCKESHEVASSFYHPIFSSTSTDPQPMFKFDTDTIYLRFETLEQLEYPHFLDYSDFGIAASLLRTLIKELGHVDNLRNIRSLALQLNTSYMKMDTLARLICRFPNLERLDLVVQDYGGASNTTVVGCFNLSLIDAVDMPAAITYYKHRSSMVERKEITPALEEMPHVHIEEHHQHPRQGWFTPQKYASLLSITQRRKMKQKLPQIAMKVSISGKLKDEFYGARKRCENAVAWYNGESAKRYNTADYAPWYRRQSRREHAADFFINGG